MPEPKFEKEKKEMWIITRPKTEVEVIGEELERLHFLVAHSKDPKTSGIIFTQIQKLENSLNEIARKKAGLEY